MKSLKCLQPTSLLSLLILDKFSDPQGICFKTAYPACAGRMGSKRWLRSFRPTSRTVFSMWSICLHMHIKMRIYENHIIKSLQGTIRILQYWKYGLVNDHSQKHWTVALKVGGKLLPGQLSSEPKNVCLMATQLSREPFVTCQWQSRVFTCSVEIKLSKSKFGFLSQQTHEIFDAFTESFLELSQSWTTLDSQLVHPQNPNHFTCCACSTVSGENTTHLGRREVLWLGLGWIPGYPQRFARCYHSDKRHHMRTSFVESELSSNWTTSSFPWSSSLSRENLFTNKKAWQTIKWYKMRIWHSIANMLIFCKGTVCLLAGKLHDSRDEPWWPGEKCR